MVKVTIRAAKFSDLKKMRSLNERNLTENYRLDFWIDIYNNKQGKLHSFVATCGNEPFGYIFADDSTIISFAVEEKFRKYGVGYQLLVHCLNTYKTDVILHVRKTNDAARNLYKKLDFVDDHLIENYYTNIINEDAYEMVHKYGKRYVEKAKINIPELKSAPSIIHLDEDLKI